MTGSDISETPKPGELAELSPDEQALVASVKEQIAPEDLVLPAIKLAQSLTKEVTEGDAKPGVYLNSLTGTEYGDDVPFVVCGIYKGRFFSDDSGTYVARGDFAPSNWPEEYAGRPFVDIEDAEEQWKLQANAEGGVWGSGPPIATTHNFVGFVPGDESDLPLRLSIMRSSKPAADKLKTLVKSLRAPWDRQFKLGVSRRLNKQEQPYYAITVGAGEPVSDEDRQKAVRIATEFKRASEDGTIAEVGDEPAAPGGAAPEKKSDDEALSVS